MNNGVWSHKVSMNISNRELGSWGYTFEETISNNSENVESITIAEIMKLNGVNTIDILKIDIEGSEKDLFETNTELWLSQIKVLIIELHDGLREGSSRSVMKAVTKLRFRFIKKDENLIFYFEPNKKK